jgi:predicted nucleic acid-binding protein
MVVADTSSVNYAILIGEIEIFQQLYETVAIPGAVLVELNHPKTPETVRNWIANIPQWFQVHSVPPNFGAMSAHLGNGERESIVLAESLRATLIMDGAMGVSRLLVEECLSQG